MRLSFSNFTFTMQAKDKDTGTNYSVRITGNEEGFEMIATPVKVEEISSDEEEDAYANGISYFSHGIPGETPKAGTVVDLFDASSGGSVGGSVASENSAGSEEDDHLEILANDRSIRLDQTGASDTSSEYEVFDEFSQEAVAAAEAAAAAKKKKAASKKVAKKPASKRYNTRRNPNK